MIAMLLVVSQKSGETVLKQLGSSTNQISIMRDRQEAVSATRTHWLPSCNWHQSSSSVYRLVSSEMTLASGLDRFRRRFNPLIEGRTHKICNKCSVEGIKIARTSKCPLWLDFQWYRVLQVEGLRQSSEIWHIPLPLELDGYYFTTEEKLDCVNPWSKCANAILYIPVKSGYPELFLRRDSIVEDVAKTSRSPFLLFLPMNQVSERVMLFVYSRYDAYRAGQRSVRKVTINVQVNVAGHHQLFICAC